LAAATVPRSSTVSFRRRRRTTLAIWREDWENAPKAGAMKHWVRTRSTASRRWPFTRGPLQEVIATRQDAAGRPIVHAVEGDALRLGASASHVTTGMPASMHG